MELIIGGECVWTISESVNFVSFVSRRDQLRYGQLLPSTSAESARDTWSEAPIHYRLYPAQFRVEIEMMAAG